MRILLLADRSFASRERQLLHRVEVGLIDDGVRVVRAIPDTLLYTETNSITPLIAYPEKVSPFLPRLRTSQLLRALRELDPPLAGPGEQPIDIVHAWGDRAWDLAVDTAEATNASLAFEVWSAGCIHHTHRMERRAEAAQPNPIQGVWIAPNRAIARALETENLRWPIHTAPWGIHPDHRPRPTHPTDQPLAVSLLATGRNAHATQTVLTALNTIIREGVELLIFLDAAAVDHRHSVWKHAARLELLPHLSVIADMESRRDLILRTDLLILPEARAEVRSILLDAMGASVAIACLTDPFVEATALPGIASLAGEPTVAGWTNALRPLLSDPELRAQQVLAAREAVESSRPVHRQVEQLLKAYQTLAEQPPLTFPSKAPAP